MEVWEPTAWIKCNEEQDLAQDVTCKMTRVAVGADWCRKHRTLLSSSSTLWIFGQWRRKWLFRSKHWSVMSVRRAQSGTEQPNCSLYYRLFFLLWSDAKPFLKEKQHDRQRCSQENNFFAMVSRVFLLFKCNVYLINNILVLNSNALSVVPFQKSELPSGLAVMSLKAALL